MGDTNRALVEAYLDELRGVRRLSPNTVESYHRDLAGLLRFAGRRRVVTLGRPDLEAFARHLMESGLSPRSVARAVACVRGFFKFLVRDGHLRQDPADELRAPRALAESAEVPDMRAGGPVASRAGHLDAGRSSATGRCSNCCMPPACGSLSWSLCGPSDLNLKAGYLTCMGQRGKGALDSDRPPRGRVGSGAIRACHGRPLPRLTHPGSSSPREAVA